jgi:hypothetical protein
MNHSQARAPLQKDAAMQAVRTTTTPAHVCARATTPALTRLLRLCWHAQVYQFLHEQGFVSSAEMLAEERSVIAAAVRDAR